MNILLTNDDGIDAEGLRTLARVLGECHRVIVVAPDAERSACAHAISIMKPLRLASREVEGAERAYALGGTPADCVKFARAELRDFAPDFVLSGINRGANLGTDVNYSGTVSAAREGAILGIPALALSDAGREDNDFGRDAGWISEHLADFVGLSHKGVFYNVNFPAGREPLRGAAPCRTGIRLYDERFSLREGHYYLSGEPVPHAGEEKCDVDCIEEGLVTVTPLHCDATAEPELESLLRLWRKA